MSSKILDPDRAPLLGSGKASINSDEEDYYSSKVINDEHPSIQEDIASTEHATKKDIFLMICINFLSFVCFAIVLPSLWPFIETVRAFILVPECFCVG